MVMTTSEAGRKGAEVTNQLLTREQRQKAAKKAWKTRRLKKRLEAQVS